MKMKTFSQRTQLLLGTSLLAISVVLTGCGPDKFAPYIAAPTGPEVVAPVTFSPAGGTFSTAQNVMLSDATKNVTIRYTLDGSVPTTTSPIYTVSLAVAASEDIKAIAIAQDGTESKVSEADFVIAQTPPPPSIDCGSMTDNTSFIGFSNDAKQIMVTKNNALLAAEQTDGLTLSCFFPKNSTPTSDILNPSSVEGVDYIQDDYDPTYNSHNIWYFKK